MIEDWTHHVSLLWATPATPDHTATDHPTADHLAGDDPAGALHLVGSDDEGSSQRADELAGTYREKLSLSKQSSCKSDAGFNQCLAERIVNCKDFLKYVDIDMSPKNWRSMLLVFAAIETPL